MKRLILVLPLVLTSCQLRDDVSIGFVIGIAVFVCLGCASLLMAEVL